LSEEKKKQNYYYGGKEKSARDMIEGQISPYNYPGGEFDKMIDRFQREMADFWGVPVRRPWRPFMPVPGRAFTMPAVDLEDRGKDYRLTVELPGFSKEDVEVQVDEETVTINAKRMRTEEEKKTNYVRHERSAQTFYRRVTLPEKVKSNDAKASLNSGILEIVMPKIEPKESKKLQIL
jgi:HSP20 family protein